MMASPNVWFKQPVVINLIIIFWEINLKVLKIVKGFARKEYANGRQIIGK